MDKFAVLNYTPLVGDMIRKHSIEEVAAIMQEYDMETDLAKARAAHLIWVSMKKAEGRPTYEPSMFAYQKCAQFASHR